MEIILSSQVHIKPQSPTHNVKHCTVHRLFSFISSSSDFSVLQNVSIIPASQPGNVLGPPHMSQIFTKSQFCNPKLSSSFSLAEAKIISVEDLSMKI